MKKHLMLLSTLGLLSACGIHPAADLAPVGLVSQPGEFKVAGDLPRQNPVFASATPYPNRLVVVRNSFHDMVTMKPDGTEQSTLYSLTGADRSLYFLLDPVWSPQKTQVAVFRKANDTGSVSLMTVQTITPIATKRLLVDNAEVNIKLDNAPQWSPDGKWLAFVGEENGQTSIYVTKSDGTMLQTEGLHSRRLPNTYDPHAIWNGSHSKMESYFHWRNDNQTIYFLKSNSLYSTKIEHSETELVLNNVGKYFSLSPDNTQIAFVRAGDIYSYNLDTKALVRRASKSSFHDSALLSDPLWSPDGRKISFVSLIPDPTKPVYSFKSEIYAHNIDTHLNSEMTRGPIETIIDYTWSADSSKVAAYDYFTDWPTANTFTLAECYLHIFSPTYGPLELLKSIPCKDSFQHDWSGL